jgi:hypothetical protein
MPGEWYELPRFLACLAMAIAALRLPDGATRMQRVQLHLTGINDPDNAEAQAAP